MPIVAALPSLADFSLLVLRLVVGLSFAMSGFYKLTNGSRRQKMETSLEEAGIPAPRLMAPVVSSGELLGGVSLVLGLFTALGALVIFAIAAVAFVTTTWPNAEGDGIAKLENGLYTPVAVQLGAALVLMAIGAGGFSIDATLF